MASIERLRVHWTGVQGLPGLSSFYFTAPTDPEPAIRNFFAALVALLPNGLTLSFDTGGDLIDDGTGAIAGSWTGTAAAAVVGTAATAYAAPVGACVSWHTTAVVAGRRPIGKTFIVPMVSTAFQSDGTLLSTTITTLQNAANALLLTSAGINMLVWSRPKSPRVGSSHPVVTAVVNDKAAVLKSRRD